jgi:hypothetical protein
MMRALNLCLPMSLLLIFAPQRATASEAFIAQPAFAPARVVRDRLADPLLSATLADGLALVSREAPAPMGATAGANSAQVFQIGANNAALLLQSGANNVAAIYQHGQHNTATVLQSTRAR